MPWPHVIAAALSGLVAAGLAWASPAVLRRLPEPEPPDEPDEADAVAEADDVGADDAEADDAEPEEPVEPEEPLAPPVPEKILYADLAARRGLAPRLAAVAGVAAAGIGLALGPDPSLPVWVVLCALGALLAYVDWHTRLLPYLLVAPAYPVVAALVLVAALVTRDWDALLRAAIAWLAVFALFWVTWFAYRKGIGYGDVRLSGVLAMALGWLGWQQVVVGLYSAFLVGAVVGGALVLLKVVDRRGFAFGPFLLVGTWLGVVLPPVLVAATT